ncbi:TPA: hypothetical protein ACH3X2_000665, partial [Trebouxia sp. C0005]
MVDSDRYKGSQVATRHVHDIKPLVKEDLDVFHDVYHYTAAQAVQSDSRHTLHSAIDLKHQQAVSTTRLWLKHQQAVSSTRHTLHSAIDLKHQQAVSSTRHILHSAIDLKHQQAVSSTSAIDLKHQQAVSST